MPSDRIENSVLTSLDLLREIESERLNEERDAVDRRRLEEERMLAERERRRAEDERARLEADRRREEILRLDEAERRARVEAETRLQERRLALEMELAKAAQAVAVPDVATILLSTKRSRSFLYVVVAVLAIVVCIEGVVVIKGSTHAQKLELEFERAEAMRSISEAQNRLLIERAADAKLEKQLQQRATSRPPPAQPKPTVAVKGVQPNRRRPRRPVVERPSEVKIICTAADGPLCNLGSNFP